MSRLRRSVVPALWLLAGLTGTARAGQEAAPVGPTATSEQPPSGKDAEEAARRQRAAVEACLASALRTARPDATARSLRAWCELEEESQRLRNEQALRARLALEEAAQYNPFVITPHNRNYLLFASYWSNPQWNDPSRGDADLDQYEAKFQLSVKSPIADGLWGDTTLYGAFTMVAFWQLYNGDLSRAFRETNYRPELYLSRPFHMKFGPIQSELVSVGYMHESNGRDVPTSRSWERLFVNYIFTTGSWYWSIRPWWRIPESGAGEDPLDPDRDDNPDIERYMGHFELTLARPYGNHVAELMFRNNLRTENRGAVQIDYSFPLSRRFKGLVQAFTGYGDSLINYDDYETRISLGVLLTDDF